MNNTGYLIIGIFIGVIVTAFNTAFAINHFIDKAYGVISEENNKEGMM